MADGPENKDLNFDINGNNVSGKIKKSGNSYTITGDVFSYVKNNSFVNDILLFAQTRNRYSLQVIQKAEAEYAIYDKMLQAHGTQNNGTHTHLLVEIEPNNIIDNSKSQFNLQLLAAIRTKPFVLLAGISGTGKSRIVRELARACYQEGSEEYKAHKPKNFEMIQVKPNWQDSTELIGYVSRIGKEPEFIAGDFLKFIVRAWKDPNTPYFLCLDEMNLAPVEQYFAEYLSVIESRKFNGEKVVTDPILRKSEDPWYHTLAATLTGDNENLRVKFLEDGISLPQNLIVVGTVNMDETTYSFSRKVLDRAMTVEMNEVNYKGGLKKNSANEFGFLGNTIIGQAVEGCDVYDTYTDVCDSVIEYLESVDEKLKDTPFRVAYRTRNEFLVYTINRIARAKNDPDFKQEEVINHAIDEMTSMKILSRIEGDRSKTESALKGVKNVLVARIGDLKSISLKKIEFMLKKLDSEYTSFWA